MEILYPRRSADKILQAGTGVKLRDDLRIRAETRVEASKPRAVPWKRDQSLPANDARLRKDKIHDLQEALIKEKDCSLGLATQIEELRDALDKERHRIRELTIKKEVALMVVDSVAKGAASMARESGEKQAKEEVSSCAKHPPKALAALLTMAPLQPRPLRPPPPCSARGRGFLPRAAPLYIIRSRVINQK